MPEWVTDALGLTSRLAGKEKNRVKTIKLRGNISQGIVAEPEIFAVRQPEIRGALSGDGVTEMLGVEKYVPPIVPSQYGDLLPLPAFVRKYDIESAQNHVHPVQALMDDRCIFPKSWKDRTGASRGCPGRDRSQSANAISV